MDAQSGSANKLENSVGYDFRVVNKSAINESDIKVNVSGKIWNTSGTGMNPVNTPDISILITSDVPLSSMQCRLERADGFLVENSVDCLYTPTSGHVAYQNLNGEYTFRIKASRLDGYVSKVH